MLYWTGEKRGLFVCDKLKCRTILEMTRHNLSGAKGYVFSVANPENKIEQRKCRVCGGR